jgi:hypothetical protein
LQSHPPMIQRKTHPWEAEIRRACRRQFLRGAAAAGGALAFGTLTLLEREAAADSVAEADDGPPWWLCCLPRPPRGSLS